MESRSLHIHLFRRGLIVALCLCFVSVFVSCGNTDKGQEWAPMPSAQFLKNVQAKAQVNSSEALAYIESAEAAKVFSRDTIHLARVIVYQECDFNFKGWEAELQAIVDSTDASHDSDFYIETLIALADVQAMQRKPESISTCLIGDSISKTINNNALRAEFLTNAGMYAVYNDIGMAKKYIGEGLEMYYSLLRNPLCEADTSTVSKIMNNSIMYVYYFYKNDGGNCIHYGERAKALLYGMDKMDMKEDVVRTYRQFKYVINHLLCNMYSDFGRLREANEAYKEVVKYSKYKSRNYNDVDCLSSMHRYDEAIVEYRKVAENYERSGDTLNFDYEHVLRNLMDCMEAKGDIDAACEMADRIISIRKLIFIENNKRQYSAWEAEYRTKEKDLALMDTKSEARVSRIITFAIGVALVAALLVLVVSLRYSRLMNLKNRALAMKVNEHLDIRMKEDARDILAENTVPNSTQESPVVEEKETSLEEENKADETVEEVDEEAAALAEAEAREKAEKDVQMFIHEIETRKLYTDSNFHRETLLVELGIGKRNFSRDFEMVTGKTVLRYISNLRIEYAAEQIRNNPEGTIEGIAMESGFASRASFYRQFSEYFGISPTEYRNRLGEASEC
ncbi:MAG: helix-turn-helix domain-containing protein [Bacteroidaceae bacterium]|nr:helix-turn-helix domain-containing protein [Bacteroidaceae bacterium]